MLPSTPFVPFPGLKKILLVGKFIHSLTTLIKPSPTGDEIDEKPCQHPQRYNYCTKS
jgi:hypothetical protein